MEKRDSRAIGLIGAGRLASALAVGLSRAGYRVTAVASSNAVSAQALRAQLGPKAEAFDDAGQVAERCDVVFLTVPDAAVALVSAGISWEPRHVVVHCSGALGLEALAAATTRGATAACFHPLQTFPSRTPEPERFQGIFCGIEAAEPAGSLLEQIARDLGATPFRLEGIDRALYHAAAVTVSNLLVALAAAGSRLWEMAGLDAASAREGLAPLLLAASQNVSKLELAKALTGPLARGDVETVERHLSALKPDPALSEIYRLLSSELLRLPLGHEAKTAARLRELLDR